MRNGSSRCNLWDAELDVVINDDAVQAPESRKPARADFRRERGKSPNKAHDGRSVVATRSNNDQG
jgi:hypothetical protein